MRVSSLTLLLLGRHVSVLYWTIIRSLRAKKKYTCRIYKNYYKKWLFYMYINIKKKELENLSRNAT